MGKPLRVLIVEDSEDDMLLLLRELRRGGYDPHYRRVDNAGDLTAALAAEPWDVVLSDHNMPQFSSTAALDQIKATGLDVPFMIVSGSIGEEAAVNAMKAGAQDYLMKGNLTRLCAAVERELADAADRRARQQAEKALLAQQEELRIAREVQARLFPSAAPRIPGFDLAGASQSAEAAGGDYYDFIPMRDGRIALVIGDVTGHGLGPALLMADARAYLRALVVSHDDIRTILTKANQLLGDDFGEERFVTILILSLSPATRTLTYLNAGHPDAHVLDAQGTPRACLEAMRPALGIAPEMAFPEPRTLTLNAGDILLLMTDGVAEACSAGGEEFGVARALSVVREAQGESSDEIVRRLFAAVQAFTSGQHLMDDATIVVLKALPH